MIDNRMLQGLLIAAAVCLVFATAMSLGDISRYNRVRVAPIASAAPSPAPAKPAPAAAAPSGQILALAPAGTVGIAHVNVQSVLKAPLLLTMTKKKGGPPADLAALEEAAVFLLPPENGKKRFAGIVKLTAGGRGKVEPTLDKSGATSTVEGLQAFQSSDGGWLAFADDNTLLGGSSKALLTTMIKLYKGQETGGADAKALDLANTYPTANIRGGFLITQAMRDAVKNTPEQVPAFLANARGMAFGITVAADLQVGALFRFATADDAQAALSAMNARLTQQKERLSAQAKKKAAPAAAAAAPPTPLSALLDKVQLSAQGTDCRISLGLDKQDVQGLAPMVAMMVMSAMVHGGPGGPGTAMPATPPGMPGGGPQPGGPGGTQ